MDISVPTILSLICAVLIGGTAALAFMGILSFTHMRLKLIVEFYHTVGKKIQREEELAKDDEESNTHYLVKYRRLQSELRTWLEKEDLVETPEEKK